MAKKISRKEFLKKSALVGSAGLLPVNLRALQGQQASNDEITVEDMKSFEKIARIEFTDEERQQTLSAVRTASNGFRQVRQGDPGALEPPCAFLPFGDPPRPGPMNARPSGVEIGRPGDLEELAFATVTELAHLVRTRQVSPVELTLMYLDRLDRFGDRLLCVITLTDDLAVEQAKQAEKEIMEGNYRGPLHGIPYGVKDLIATRSYPTTWGAAPYRDQVFDYDAAVVEKLNAAGAVMVAKLSLGSLAYNDVWFGGRTKNPWNPEQGSSGSSAGSACATAAGLVGFSIGSETLGSIVSPSVRCRVTGLRPTYGRVSRFGAMELSWTMDKLGPLCRKAEDCALVLAAIAGRDSRDASTVDAVFDYRSRADLRGLKIGYIVQPQAQSDPDIEADAAAKLLMEMGAEFTPVRMPRVPPVMTILSVEAAAAFDDFTLEGRYNELTDSIWPNNFRSSRYVPAVEYLRAQRARASLMREYHELTKEVDLLYGPQNGGAALSITNLTGHPQILVPNGTDGNGNPRSISFIGKLYEEHVIASVADAYQNRTGHYRAKPDLTVF